MIDDLPENGEEFRVFQGRRALGRIYRFKGETEKTIRHLEMALGIASSLNAARSVQRSRFGR